MLCTMPPQLAANIFGSVVMGIVKLWWIWEAKWGNATPVSSMGCDAVGIKMESLDLVITGTQGPCSPWYAIPESAEVLPSDGNICNKAVALVGNVKVEVSSPENDRNAFRGSDDVQLVELDSNTATGNDWWICTDVVRTEDAEDVVLVFDCYRIKITAKHNVTNIYHCKKTNSAHKPQRTW